MLGGDALLAGAANITFDIPGTPLQRLGIRGHIFANAASLISLSGA
jgi:hypothetical protein